MTKHYTDSFSIERHGSLVTIRFFKPETATLDYQDGTSSSVVMAEVTMSNEGALELMMQLLSMFEP